MSPWVREYNSTGAAASSSVQMQQVFLTLKVLTFIHFDFFPFDFYRLTFSHLTFVFWFISVLTFCIFYFLPSPFCIFDFYRFWLFAFDFISLQLLSVLTFYHLTFIPFDFLFCTFCLSTLSFDFFHLTFCLVTVSGSSGPRQSDNPLVRTKQQSRNKHIWTCWNTRFSMSRYGIRFAAIVTWRFKKMRTATHHNQSVANGVIRRPCHRQDHPSPLAGKITWSVLLWTQVLGVATAEITKAVLKPSLIWRGWSTPL